MLSKSRVKFIKYLQLKKYRKQEQCFTVEGAKSVQELLTSNFECHTLVCTDSFVEDQRLLLDSFTGELIVARPAELQRVSEYKTNDAALAVARIKENNMLDIGANEYALILDDIRDPGNLGTIIRTADWFGISKIIASNESADIYNSKVIQASMGSFTRVEIYYTTLNKYLSNIDKPVFGTFLDGEDVHTFNFGKAGFIVIGNESNGISSPLEKLVTQRITIPRYGNAESLNAALATAIICDNIRRK
jgi:TrmH family RNA methyltransferase